MVLRKNIVNKQAGFLAVLAIFFVAVSLSYGAPEISVSGQLVGKTSNQGVSGAVVRLKSPDGAANIYIATTDDKGNFAIHSVSVGKYKFIASNSQGVFYRQDVEIGVQQKPLVVTVEDRTLSTVVTAADGKPANGAFCVLMMEDRSLNFLGRTDASGQLKLSQVPPGKATLSIMNREDHSFLKQSVEIAESDNNVVLPPITLTKPEPFKRRPMKK